MLNDMELLEAWRGGDRKAGDALFLRYFDSIERFFRNKVPEAMKDLVQQTFTACVEGRDRIRSTSSFRSYLFAVAYNQLRKHLRTKYRSGHEIDVESQSLHDLAPGPRTLVGERREERLLLEAVRLIPLEHQVLFELRYWEEMKTREIAEILDIPDSTLRTRLRRALQLLREAVQGLAGSAGELESTLDNLDNWAERCRVQVEAAAEAALDPDDGPDE